MKTIFSHLVISIFEILISDNGVFTTAKLLQGAFICEYHGELLSDIQGEERRNNYEEKDGNFMYFFEHNGQKFR